ncbi:hypothetical protein FOZ60_012072, partial [Perkinsus olseni]
YSLKNLLDFYCGYKADKANQLADWRQRPLSDRMKQYARDDVHYLLYVYDRMRAQLLCAGGGVDEGKVTAYGRKMYMSTINRSCDVALKTYKDSDSDFMEHAITLSCKTNTPLSLVGRPMLAALIAALTGSRGGSGNVARQVRENADEVLAVLQYAALHPKAPIPEAGVAPKEGGKESQQSSPLPPATPERKRRKSPASVASAGHRTRKTCSSVRDEPVVLNASRIEALDAGEEGLCVGPRRGALPPHQPSGPTDVLSVDTVIGDDGKIAATVDGVRAALGVALTESASVGIVLVEGKRGLRDRCLSCDWCGMNIAAVLGMNALRKLSSDQVPAELASTMYLARQKEANAEEKEGGEAEMENPVVASTVSQPVKVTSGEKKETPPSPEVIHLKGTKGAIPKSIRQAYANRAARQEAPRCHGCCGDPQRPSGRGKRSAASQALKFIEQEFDLKDDDDAAKAAQPQKKKRKNRRQGSSPSPSTTQEPAGGEGGFAKPKGIAKRQRR